MDFDIADLVMLNERIGEEESLGARQYLDEEVLAPAFAMSRANGSIVVRDEYLSGIKTSAQRSTEVLSVSLLGQNRATVSCIVTQNGE